MRQSEAFTELIEERTQLNEQVSDNVNCNVNTDKRKAYELWKENIKRKRS